MRRRYPAHPDAVIAGSLSPVPAEPDDFNSSLTNKFVIV
jgi:hypothetical protein